MFGVKEKQNVKNINKFKFFIYKKKFLLERDIELMQYLNKKKNICKPSTLKILKTEYDTSDQDSKKLY